MIRLTINNKQVTAKRGETVLEVAQREGIYIPTLCFHKDLSAYGGCRLCIVEVKGWTNPVTACTLPAEDGMIIKTDTPRLKELRTFSLQLILSEHPHACLICDREEECAQYQECIQKSSITFGCKFCSSNGDCELQDLIDRLGITEIPYEFRYRQLAVEKSDPFFERDYNLCVLCGRCIRACGEKRDAHILDFIHRGPQTLVGTAFGLTHLELGCQFCGACVDVCPTGALRERYSMWAGLPERSVRSTCALCSIGCSMQINVGAAGIINTVPDRDELCVRGRFGIAPIVHHPKRVTSPLLKKGKRLVQVSWPEALEYACAQLNEHQKKTGILFSPQLSVESIDAAVRLADHLACHLTTSSVLVHDLKALNIKDIQDEAVFVFLNTDMIDYSPLFSKLRSRLKKRPLIITIDAVASKGAEKADVWLRPMVGKESQVLQYLFAQKEVRTTDTVSKNIREARALLNGKHIYVFYTAQTGDIAVPKHVTKVPLTSMTNALTIRDMGIDTSPARVLHDKNVDCLYVLGAAPQLSRSYASVIVQNCFLPQFDFDVFLPTAVFAEVNGTVITIEGKKRKLRKACEPVGNAKPDDWILTQMCTMLGCKKRRPASAHPKPRRALRPRQQRRSETYPLQLVTRENAYVYRGNALSSLMKGFDRLRRDRRAWVHPRTAKKYGLKNDVTVDIIGHNVTMRMPVLVTDAVPENVVVVYHRSDGIVESQPVRLVCTES